MKKLTINNIGQPKGAWSLEISVAIIGLIIAVANTSVITESLTNMSLADVSGIVVIASVLVISAIIELTKIPFMKAFMITKKKSWRLTFLAILACVSFITFETLSNGFISAFDARNQNLNVLLVDINEKQSTLEGLNTLGDSGAKNPYPAQIESLNNQRLVLMGNLATEIIPLNAELERLKGLKVEDKGGLKLVLDSKRSSQQLAQQSLDSCTVAGPFVSCENQRSTLRKANKKLTEAEDNYSAPSKYDVEINQMISKIAAIEATLATHPKIVELDQQIEKSNNNSNNFINKRVLNTEMVEELNTEIAVLEKQLDKDGRGNFTYSIAKFFDLQLDKATTWLSMLVAVVITIVGPAMAAHHYLPVWVNFFKSKPKAKIKTKRKSKFRALARSIILKKRKPTIKEVEVEVIKEVEVPVEKIVEVVKEVEVMVEKTIVKHVPVYTNNEDLLELTKEFKMDEELKDEHK